MKKLFAVITAILMMFAAGCGARGAAAGIEQLPAEDNAKEITIAVIDYGNFYNEAAKKYEAKTGVKVHVINYYNEETDSVDDIITKSNAELMAGKGADLYACDYLDFKSLGKKELVCDLKSWVSKDPFFSEDQFFMNILNASLNDNRFALPQGFSVTKLEATSPVPKMEDAGSLTWEQFFDKENDFQRSGRLLKMYDFGVFEQRFRARAPFFINEETKSQQLDSKEMIDLLVQCKKWADQDLCIPTTEQDGYNDYSLFEASDVIKPGIYALNNIFDTVYYVYDLPSDFTDNHIDNYAAAKDYVIINAASKNKKTSWDFIKYLLGYNMQISQESFYLPMNRAALNMEADYALNILQKDGLIDNPLKEKNDILEKVESIQNIQKYDESIRIVCSSAYRYFAGEISAEQAAKEMASKIHLYLLEQ